MMQTAMAMSKPGSAVRDEDSTPNPLLSDEPTIELVVRAKAGDRTAMEALLERCLPLLKRSFPAKIYVALASSLMVFAYARHFLISNPDVVAAERNFYGTGDKAR